MIRPGSESPHRDHPELPAHPACTFCRGVRTELVSAFGAHASVSTYWCRDCGSPFEMLKWRAPGSPGPPAGEEGGAGRIE
jgi:hypothetical protein